MREKREEKAWRMVVRVQQENICHIPVLPTSPPAAKAFSKSFACFAEKWKEKKFEASAARVCFARRFGDAMPFCSFKTWRARAAKTRTQKWKKRKKHGGCARAPGALRRRRHAKRVAM